MKIDSQPTGEVTFSIDSVDKGQWSWPSPAGTPEGFVPLIQNFDLWGSMPTSMLGDAVFIDSAYDAASTVTLACTFKPAGSGDPVILVGTSLGNIIRWNGASWQRLRSGLSTAAGIWWSHQQYGTDLFISNATDGIYRYDATNDTLVPIGSKSIAQAENDEAAQWTNETADTVNFREGLQSMKVASANPGSSAKLTYTPTTAIDVQTGRGSAIAYKVSKSPGTDFYHFFVRFSAGATSTITAANTTFVITDSNAKSLTWDATKWRSAKTPTAAAIPLNDNNWHDVYCYANDATEAATFDPTKCAKFEWQVTTGAGQTDMAIDDVYVIYATTMPPCQIVIEWKNVLFGFNQDQYNFSRVAAPDEYSNLAFATIKGGGEWIGGVGRFFNQLTIGTDTKVITLSGSLVGQTYPSYIFDQNEVSDEIGISSHRSIVKAEGRLLWYWKGNIIQYNGTQPDHLSYPIDPTFADIDESAAQFVVAAPYRDKHEVWWTCRRLSHAVNDLVIKFNYYYKCFLSVSGLTTPVVFKSKVSEAEKCLTIDETSRKIYVQNQTGSYSFVGVPIVYVIDLPAMSIPGTTFTWELAWIQYLQNTGNLLVQYRHGDTLRALQQAAYTTAETINMTLDGEYSKERIGEFSSWVQIRLTATGAKAELQPPFVILARPMSQAFVRTTP